MTFTLDKLKTLCKYSFKEFLTNDIALIKNKSYEPTVSGRVAMYFRDCLRSLEIDGIFVDVEYNKFENYEKLKKQNESQTKNNTPIRPDIIIHERQKQDNNLLYLELKKYASRYGHDRKKVEQQVLDKNYKFGLFINKINKKQIDFQIYINDNWVEYFYILKTNEIVEITNE